MPGRSGGPARRFLRRLGVRQALLLSVTLLPLGVILLIQLSAVEREVHARTQSALTGATLSAGAHAKRRIEESRGAVRALAAVVSDVVDDRAACDRLLRAYVAEMGGQVDLAGLVSANGATLCAAGDRPIPVPAAAAALQTPEPLLAVERIGSHALAAMVTVSHPVRDRAGEFRGYLTLVIPHGDFLGIDGANGEAKPIALLTFDAEGQIVTGSGGLADAEGRVPADRALKALASDHPVAFDAVSRNGNRRVYSVVPIVDGKMFMMGSWRVEDAGQAAALGGLPPVVFASLMWIASLATALLGAEKLVSRHIRALGKSMTAFAAGDRRVAAPDLRSAPVEIGAVGAAYARLTEAIVRDEADLENALHHKDLLLREVHHRVKNNLQLIASIMNLQMRKARSPEAKNLLRGLQDRVMSLATVHRELYQTSGEAEVRADELLADITRQVLKLATGANRRFEVRTGFDPLVLVPDQAVPLALLVTEALTNAIKHAGAVEDRPSSLSVTLRDIGEGRALLEVANSVPAGEGSRADDRAGADDDAIADSTGLGSQLIAAFAQQVGGAIEVQEGDGAYVLALAFPVQSADAAAQDEEVNEDEEVGVDEELAEGEAVREGTVLGDTPGPAIDT